jgi:hypothetical protein
MSYVPLCCRLEIGIYIMLNMMFKPLTRQNETRWTVSKCSLMIPPLFGKQEVGIWRVKKRFPRYGVCIWSLWPNIRFLPSIVAEKNATKNGHIQNVCSMCIKICWEKCDEKCAYMYMFNVYKNQLSRQTGSRNLTGPKTLPTIWHTYMKLVAEYQIPVINSCLEKCNKKCAYTNVC